MADFDWRRYVNVNGEGPTADAVEQALDEFASTPEGQQLIRDAYSGTPGAFEKVDIDLADIPDGIRGLFGDAYVERGTNDIKINADGSDMRYPDADGNFHDMTIQRMLHHELVHVAYHDKLSLGNEQDAIDRTNEYMSQYYGEPPNELGKWAEQHEERGSTLAEAYAELRQGGSTGWDISDDYNGPEVDAVRGRGFNIRAEFENNAFEGIDLALLDDSPALQTGMSVDDIMFTGEMLNASEVRFDEGYNFEMFDSFEVADIQRLLGDDQPGYDQTTPLYDNQNAFTLT